MLPESENIWLLYVSRKYSTKVPRENGRRGGETPRGDSQLADQDGGFTVVEAGAARDASAPAPREPGSLARLER